MNQSLRDTCASRAALEQQLEQEAKRLQAAIACQEELARPGAHPGGDEGDHALADSDQSRHRAMVEHLKQMLAQIQAARERMAEGMYGICSDCARPIPAERLEALPYATLCVHCQSRREQAKSTRARLALLAQRPG